MKSKINKLWLTTLMLVGSVVGLADNNGIGWLNSQVQADGSFQSDVGLELTISTQATAASLNTYLYFNYINNSILMGGINYLENNHLMSTESISELLIIQDDYTTVDPLLLNALSNRINADGGLGELSGFESNVLDSAYALYGLSVADESYDDVRLGLLAYLLNQMQANGGFKFQFNEADSLHLAINVLRAMNANLDISNRYRYQYDLLKQHIIAMKLPGAGWGSVYETAMVLNVLEDSQAYYAEYWDAIVELRAARSANYSWQDEVFTTAIALIALNKTKSYQEPSGLSSISGQVVDSLTYEIIGFAQVNLDGNQSYGLDSLGYFSINELTLGEHALVITAPGYIEQSFNLNLAENQNLSLETITLLKKPNTGVLMGQIKAHEDHAPINNVLISVVGAANLQIQTNQQGAYAMELAPGAYTVTASINNRDDVVTTFTILDGQLLNFSPEMYLSGTTPWLDSTTIKGRLLATADLSAINGAAINVDGTAVQTNSNQSGEFELIDLDNGSIAITIVAPGFQVVHISVISNGGMIDLGDVSVPATNSNSTGRLFGQIKDLNTLNPIPSAEVEIQGEGLSTFSDQSGNYVIEGIPEFNYTATVSAAGYIPRNIDITATQHMNTQLNVDLTSSNNQSLVINEFLPEQFVVTQEGPLDFEIEVANTANAAVDSLMYISVFNEANTLIDRFSLSEELVDGVIEDAPITIGRQSSIQLNTNWTHDQLPQGFYRIELKLFDSVGVVLLAQRAVEIEIKSFMGISAQLSLDPQVAAFNNTNPIELKADILNSGNLPIIAGEMSAKVYLRQKFESPYSYDIVSSDINSSLINSDTWGMVKSIDGDIYIAKGGEVLKMDATEQISVFASGFSSARDLELAANGHIYVLDTNTRSIIELDDTGAQVQSMNHDLSSSYTFKLFGEDFLIGSPYGLYRFNLTTELVEVVTENQMRYPNNLAVDNNDDIYILDGYNNGNSGIFKYSNNVTTKYFNDLNNPTGIVMEDNGDLIVSDRNSAEIVRIDTNQVKHVITDQIPFPEGIAKANNGNYLVTSLNDQVWEVTPAGQVTPFSSTAIGYPKHISRDDTGGFYSFNDYDNLIYHFDAAQNGTLYNLTTFDAVDLHFDGNVVWVAEEDSIHRINTDQTVDSFSVGVSEVNALSFDSVEGVIVFLTGHAVKQLDPATGSVTDYIQPFLYNDVKALSVSGMDIKVSSNKGQILTLKNDLSYESFAQFTGTIKDMYEATSGVTYVALSDKSIHSIDEFNQSQLVATLANVPEQIVVDTTGVVFYTNNSNTIFKHDAGVEMALNPFSFNVVSELELDDQNNLWVANNRSAGAIAKYDLTLDLISEFVVPNSLQSYSYPNGVHAVSHNEIIIGVRDGLVLFNGSEFVDLFNVPELAGRYVQLVKKTTDGRFWLNTNNDELMLFSAEGELIKQSGPTTLYDTQFPLDIVNYQSVTTVASRGGVFQYTTSNTIPEFITANYMSDLAIDTDGEIYMASNLQRPKVYKYNNGSEELEEILSYDRYLSGLEITSDGSKIIGSSNYYKNLIAIWDMSGNLEKHYSAVFDPNGIITDQATGEVFILANSNNDILKLTDNGLAELLFFSTNANYFIKDGNYLVITRSQSVIRYDLTTGVINGENSPFNNGAFEGIAQMNNGDYVMASSSGLFTFNGESFAKIGGGLNYIVDINSLTDGTPLLLSSAGSSSSIYQLNPDDSFSLLHSGLELEALSGGFSIFEDEIFVGAQSNKEIIKIDQYGSRTVYGKIPSRSGIGQVLAVSPTDLYVQDNYADTTQKLYKARLVDNSESEYSPGDLIYSQSDEYTAMPVNSPQQTLDFGSFIPPVAGNYEVELESDNQDIGFVTNSALHVGVLAEGQFSNLTGTTLPGDYMDSTNLTVSGIETVDSLIVQGETKVELIPSFPGGGRFEVDRDGNIVSIKDGLTKYDANGNLMGVIFNDFAVYYMNTDNEGYIHAKNNTQVVKLDVDGTVLQTTDLTSINSNIHREFDVDSNGNYWLSKGGNILNIEAGTGQVLDQLSLDNTDYVVFVDEADNLLLASGSDILYFNINSRDIRVLVDYYGMEAEGFNYDYACGNLIFSPNRLPSLYPEYNNYEEFYIAKINPDIGVVQTVYDSRLYGGGEDIDSFNFDQLNKRLLMYTDRQLKQMDFNCNSIRVELHIEMMSDVQITQSSVQPIAVNIVNSNTEEWVWYLDDVDSNLQNIEFDLLYEDLIDGETRAAFNQAYLLYTNPLDSTQDIRIDLDIPTISAETQKQLNVILDNSSYAADSQMLINNEVINDSVIEFNGFITQVIETETRQYVNHLDNLAINALPSGQSLVMDSSWSTANIYAGHYILVSELVDASGHLQNRVETSFEIVVSDSGYDVSFNALSNQSQYNQNDSVEISSTLTNLATNAILENMSLELVVSAPDASIILQQSSPVNDLAANASQQWQDLIVLNQAQVGVYTVTFNLLDEFGNVVETYSYSFEVLLSEQLSLSGDVTIDFEEIQPGVDNTCHFELSNQSADPIMALDIELLVVNLSNQLTVQSVTQQIDLAPGETWQGDLLVPTNSLSSGDHACLIRTLRNGIEVTQGSAVFIVTGANQIIGQVFDDFNGDGIKDNVDTGIANVELMLLDSNQTVIQTINSGNEGNYQFQPVDNGSYEIVVTESGVLQNALMTSNNNNTALDIEFANITTDFGYQFSDSRVQGTIWNDENDDGHVDIDENGFDNVSIRLLDSELNEFAVTSTNNDGLFEFNQITSGPYQLEVTDNQMVLAGLRNTTENQPMPLDIFSHADLTGTNFGYRQDTFDLDVFTTNCTKAVKEGQQITYLVQVNNLGNTDIQDAAVENLVPLGLTNVSWTCEATGGATCSGSGVDDVLDLIDIPQDGQVNYTIEATVSGQLLDIIEEQVSITMPVNITDDNEANNQAFDSDMVLDLHFIDGFECSAPTAPTTTNKQLIDLLFSASETQPKQLMNYINQQISNQPLSATSQQGEL